MNGSKGSINDNVSSYYKENLLKAFIDFKKYTTGFENGKSFNEKELSEKDNKIDNELNELEDDNLRLVRLLYKIDEHYDIEELNMENRERKP